MAEGAVRSARECIYAEVQSHAGDEETGAPAESVLTGFLMIAEWESPNGDRWISKLSGDHSRTLPPWRERGLAAEVLHAWWGDETDGGDEDNDE